MYITESWLYMKVAVLSSVKIIGLSVIYIVSLINIISIMKKTLYPKTKRISDEQIIITEKLDGSNLWLFRLNGEILIAQRNHVLKISELNKENAYKWLIWWLEENKDKLDILEWSWLFWELIWMGKIWYWDRFKNRFHIFAKANIYKEEWEIMIKKLNYPKHYIK